jgi:hypothetical protein
MPVMIIVVTTPGPAGPDAYTIVMTVFTVIGTVAGVAGVVITILECRHSRRAAANPANPEAGIGLANLDPVPAPAPAPNPDPSPAPPPAAALAAAPAAPDPPRFRRWPCHYCGPRRRCCCCYGAGWGGWEGSSRPGCVPGKLGGEGGWSRGCIFKGAARTCHRPGECFFCNWIARASVPAQFLGATFAGSCNLPYLCCDAFP